MQFWIWLMRYLHVLSIAAYLGGAFVMEFVLAPAQAAIPPAQAQVMGEKTSKRYLIVAWSALTTLLLSCTTTLFLYKQLTWSWPFFQGDLKLSHSYGRTTLLLFIFWCILVTNGAILTFKIRPTLSQKFKAGATAQGVAAKQEGQMKAAKWASRITRIDLVIGVCAAILGVSLATRKLFL